ncbi:hypothetical protein [Hymenobacter cheonanensis]|uniref:hypothetical protein n=1 Tax=Hymenobacter sp. CA2-7 TaxID=3063993 RepID=UPI0027128024|nr:hypothetical protein [Hymenobacter sp. CA2-7]MDO7887968.1 hypothetical protein [Hymenobacter sp. CA2-7]
MNRHWKDYPAAVLTATPEQVSNALAAHYQQVETAELTQAASEVGRGLAIVEEGPRGTLGTALRGHLNVIVAEQQRRGEVAG